MPATSTPSHAAAPSQSHKRRRAQNSESHADPSLWSCATSGESSEEDELEPTLWEEARSMVQAKRRRRADLDGLKKSVRRMEVQVSDASAKLRDLRALVAHVVAQRQQQCQA